MKLKLDENISRHLKPVLENLNYDVLTVSDQGLLSQNDTTTLYSLAGVCRQLREIIVP